MANMETTIATAVGTGGLAPTRDRAPAAIGQSLAWRRFLRDLSNAVLMMDPMGCGWYWEWTREARG